MNPAVDIRYLTHVPMPLYSGGIQRLCVLYEIGKLYACLRIEIPYLWIDTESACLSGIELLVVALYHSFGSVTRNAEHIAASVESNLEVLVAHSADFRDICRCNILIREYQSQMLPEIVLIKRILLASERLVQVVL